MHTANQSVLLRFNRTVDRIAGKTELQVTAGETGFDEEVLETVQAAPSVRVAVPMIEAVVDSQIAGEGNLLILGVDMTGDRSLRDYDLERATRRSSTIRWFSRPARFAHPDAEFADENGVERERADPARHGGRGEAVHRPGHHEVGGARERVRRQPRHHGYLRRAEDVRARPDVRSHRSSALAARPDDRGAQRELGTLLDRGFRSNRRPAAASSSRR